MSRQDKEIAEAKQWLDEHNRKTQQIAQAFESNPVRSHIEDSMEEEIFEAAVSTRNPELSLGAVAKAYGVSTSVVEGIAKKLLGQRLGVDADAVKYRKTVERIKSIYENIEDPGLQAWKIQQIAREVRRSPAQLLEAFNKSLLAQGELKVKKLKDIRKKNITTNWLVPGWMVKGELILLHGDGGSGKTLLSYQILEKVMKGGDLWGFPLAPHKCALVQLDEPERTYQERLDLRDMSGELDVLDEWQIEQLPLLARFLERERIEFLLIDSLTGVNRNCLFSENDTEYARPLLHLADVLDRLACTCLLIHHSSALGRARGTTAIRNSANAVWNLREGDVLNRRKLIVDKTRTGMLPGNYSLEFDEDTLTFDYLGLEGDEDSAGSDRLLLWLGEDQNKNRRFTARELAELTGINSNTVRRRVYELYAKQLVERVKTQNGYAYYLSCKETLNVITGDHCHSDTPITLCDEDTVRITDRSDRLISGSPKNTKENPRDLLITDHFPQNSPNNQGFTGDHPHDHPLTRSDRPDHPDHISSDSDHNCDAKVNGSWYRAKYLGERQNMKILPDNGKLGVWARVEIQGKKYEIPMNHVRFGSPVTVEGDNDDDI